MSAKGRNPSPTPGKRPVSRTASGKPPPPPGALPPPGTLPALPGAASKRYDWIDSTLGADAGGGIKAARPASRAAGTGSGRASPDFWGSSKAPQLLDATVKHPELKLQLLARALEESRAKVAHLQQDRAALADAILQLCEAAGADGCGGGGGDEHALAGGDAGADPAGSPEPAAAGGEEDALPQHLDLLSTRVAALREALALQTVAAAEAAAAHERAALQAVAQRQQREALERQLEEVGWSISQAVARAGMSRSPGTSGYASPTAGAACFKTPPSPSHCPIPPAGPVRGFPARAGSAGRRAQGGAAGGAGGGGGAVGAAAHGGAAGHVSGGCHNCQARLLNSVLNGIYSSSRFRPHNANCGLAAHAALPMWAPPCCPRARTLRARFAELEQQLDAARKAQAADADCCRQLEAAGERLQGRLKEAGAKQAELSQQLWWVGLLGGDELIVC